MLKELRGKIPITKVSEETGIKVRTLRSYESGERTPSDKNKIILANYFNESVESIFFENQLHK